MKTQEKVRMQTVSLVAEVIRKLTGKKTQAQLISGLLSCDQYDTLLTDNEASVGMDLFELLCDRCGPDVVEMAQNS